MTNSYYQNLLHLMAEQLEKTHTPRELTIKYILAQEEIDQLKAAAAINEQAAELQLEAVANDRDYQKTLLENERAAWGKITRQLHAKLDNMTDALETAERQILADADNLTAVLEAGFNAESVYIAQITDLMDENQALKEKLKAILAIINT